MLKSDCAKQKMAIKTGNRLFIKCMCFIFNMIDKYKNVANFVACIFTTVNYLIKLQINWAMNWFWNARTVYELLCCSLPEKHQ